MAANHRLTLKGDSIDLGVDGDLGCNSPPMSVVMITPDRYETIRQTMLHLRAQTIRDRLEIVIGLVLPLDLSLPRERLAVVVEE